jgi:imidazolonepropionase-like amidohydrolase
MAYVELKYYRSYIMEVREYGDTGWAIHVYRPRRGGKVAIVQTTDSAELGSLMDQARAAIEADGAQRQPAKSYRSRETLSTR